MTWHGCFENGELAIIIRPTREEVNALRGEFYAKIEER